MSRAPAAPRWPFFLALPWVLGSALQAAPKADGPAVAVATFECVGLSWKPTGGAPENACQVQYRASGSNPWKDGLDLWFDPRAAEYRGSIVGLNAATTYEVKLTLASGAAQSTAATTWAEKFPLASTVSLPASSKATLEITQSGTPAGYILYTAAAGQSATIDVAGTAATCISINASYVIVRGVTCQNAKANGITLLGQCHHVVIEGCEVSGWGQSAQDGWGIKDQSGIFSEERAIHHVVVQRNRIHHPRSDSNNWLENRPLYKNGAHPNGPQGISFFKNNAGNNVIRYNEIYSDLEHMFNDGIGGGDNFSHGGFPGKDSDVYGNIVTHCWDNPLEIEGGGRNVRVWGNFTDQSYTSIGVAACSVGPLYVFRNVSNRCFKDPSFSATGTRFLKAGSTTWHGEYFGDGKIYVFHNLALQELSPSGAALGAGGGIDGSAGTLTNLVSRNNVWFIRNPAEKSIKDNNSTSTPGIKTNDLDYDLFNGLIATSLPQAETHGLHSAPTLNPQSGNRFNPFKGPLRLALKEGTKGFDAGERLKNFNDAFQGAAPEMGASESGTALEFGVSAYLNGGSAAKQ